MADHPSRDEHEAGHREPGAVKRTFLKRWTNPPQELILER